MKQCPVLFVFLFALLLHADILYAQIDQSEDSTSAIENRMLDSLFILEVEETPMNEPNKILHAEPLYIDLIRDLGARKGEKEWNMGAGITDNSRYDKYEALIEYEWAPIDRLGLEVELPFSFYYPTEPNTTAPESKLNSLKLAGQYTFLVSTRWNTSMALGYIHEFEMTEFSDYRNKNFFTGNKFNPFLITAKRWANNYHTLIYTGPTAEYLFHEAKTNWNWEMNTNFHYMITGTRNFIGIEFNKSFTSSDFDMTIRPQMRVGIADNFLIGIVTGIPIKRETQRFSSFLRVIYEPGHRHKH